MFKTFQGQSEGLGIEDELDMGTVIGSAKIQYAQTWHCGLYGSKKGVLDHACPQQRHT